MSHSLRNMFVGLSVGGWCVGGWVGCVCVCVCVDFFT